MKCRFVPLLLFLLAGCVSDIPRGVREAPGTVVSVAQVQSAPDAHLGEWVRWGGEIISVDNQPEFSYVEILARELGASGKPLVDGRPDARFLARVAGFLDPADFRAGQRMTVSAQVEGTRIRKIGEYPYRYPVVVVQQYYRWPATDPRRYYDPWWDPFYGPWWHHPFHHYPHWW